MILGNYRLMGIALKKHFLECEAELAKMPKNTLKEKRAVFIQSAVNFCSLQCAFMFPLWSTALILSAGVYFFGKYASVIGTVGVLVWMVCDWFLTKIKPQPEQTAAQQAVCWDMLASYVVCPVLTTLTKRETEPEALYYSGQLVFGNGYYFRLPIRIKDKNSEVTLLRKLERRYAEVNGIDWKVVAQAKKIRVSAEFVFFSEGL